MSDDGPDAIGKNFASYLKTEGLPSNSQLKDWLRSAFTAAQGEPISISPLAALLIVEILGRGSAATAGSPTGAAGAAGGPAPRGPSASERRGRGRPKKISAELSAEQGEKIARADWDFYFQFRVIRERFEKNNDPAPTQRAYEEIATERGIQAEGVKQEAIRAGKRIGVSFSSPRFLSR
jgi:hypothetical protein